MRGWNMLWLIICLVGGKTIADTSSQSLTAPPGVSGIPPAYAICTWAHCKGLCQVKTTVPSLDCSDVLRNSSYAELSCQSKQYEVCIGPASGIETSRCRPNKGKTSCFKQNHNIVKNRYLSEICQNANSCEDLSQFCSSNGYMDCSYYGHTTYKPPTTLSRDPTTRNQPIATTVGFTSEYNVTSSSLNPPDSAKSLAFVIGIVVGSFLIALIFVIILLICVIRNHGRKKYGVPKQAENFEMNEGAVYQEIGPELPPNHPSLRKGGNPANQANTSCSSRSLEVTMETRHTEAGNLQESQDTPYFVLESKDEQYQEGINRDNSRGTGSKFINTSGTTYVDNKIYNSSFIKAGDRGNNGHDVTRVYTQLQRNGKEYSQTDDVREHANKLSTCYSSKSDRPYMALNVTDVDGGDVTASNEEIEHGACTLHSSENPVDDNAITSRDRTKEVRETEMKKDAKLNHTDVSQLGSPSYDTMRVADQESGTEINKIDRQRETIEDNGSELNASPSCNFQKGSTTFPRPKSLKVPSSGSATSKKSRFLSLRFGSKKKHKLSKKKLKSFHSADDSELCLDLTISSPTSPTEEKGTSFFTAEIPLIHPPPQEQEVSEKLSKSQEAIFDDVNNDPFRNRSRSQPIRQTFSPTLCKEYEEIKESWGATYLQVPSQDQK